MTRIIFIMVCCALIIPNRALRSRSSTRRLGISSAAEFSRATMTRLGVSVEPDGVPVTQMSDKSVPKWVNEVNKSIVNSIKDLLAGQFEGKGRDYARFYALETIARVPYFSYTSVLHLYETIGHFRDKEYIKLHFDQAWNELHHLLIMEELGGAAVFSDRFVAVHLAFFYYWAVVVMFMLSPAAAYNFNKEVEAHAYKTYDAFLHEHADELRALPVPEVARDYYEGRETTFSDRSFLSADRGKTIPRPEGEPLSAAPAPPLTSLYDVFVRIRDDEAEHAYTMSLLEGKCLISNREDNKN